MLVLGQVLLYCAITSFETVGAGSLWGNWGPRFSPQQRKRYCLHKRWFKWVDWNADLDWTGLECGCGWRESETGCGLECECGLEVNWTWIGVRTWPTGPRCKFASLVLWFIVWRRHLSKSSELKKIQHSFFNCWRCEDVRCVKISWPCITLKHPSESPVWKLPIDCIVASAGRVTVQMGHHSGSRGEITYLKIGPSSVY